MNTADYLRRIRANPTLPAHIVLFEVLFGLPLFLFFAVQSYGQGTFTLGRALYLLLLWATGGAVVATVIWFTLSLPLIRRRRR
jgi:predicted membrane protein